MDHGHLIARCDKGPHGHLLRIVKCKDLIPEYVNIARKPISMMAFGRKWESNGNPLQTGALFNRNILKAGVFHIRDIPGFVRLFYNMIKSANKEKAKALDQVDLLTFLSRYTENELIHVMMDALAAGCFGLLPDETSTGETLRTFKGMVKARKGGYPVTGEGISAIPKSFIRAAERYGAEIQTKTPKKDMLDAREGRIPKDTAIMFVCTSNIDPRLAPPGKQLLLAISPGPPIEPGKIDWDPWVENLKRQIEEYVPGISKHTIFCDAYTPDAIARQNGRYYGDAIGVAQTTNQVGDNAPSAFSPIRNLYHAGADVGSKGVATEMATESAIDLIEELKRKNLLP